MLSYQDTLYLSADVVPISVSLRAAGLVPWFVTVALVSQLRREIRARAWE